MLVDIIIEGIGVVVGVVLAVVLAEYIDYRQEAAKKRKKSLSAWLRGIVAAWLTASLAAARLRGRLWGIKDKE
jgi:urea transporter